MSRKLIILDVGQESVKETISHYKQNQMCDIEFVIIKQPSLWAELEHGERKKAEKIAEDYIMWYKPDVIVANGFAECGEQIEIFKQCSNAVIVGNSRFEYYNNLMMCHGAAAIFAKGFALNHARNDQYELPPKSTLRGMDPDFVPWLRKNYDAIKSHTPVTKVVKNQSDFHISHYPFQQTETEDENIEKTEGKIISLVPPQPEEAKIINFQPTVITKKPWWKLW